MALRLRQRLAQWPVLVQRGAAGLVLTALLAALALAGEQGLRLQFGQSLIEALVLALLLGVLVRQFVRLPASVEPGIQLAAKPLLELAVCLLGASISLPALVANGLPLLLAIAGVVALGIGTSLLLGRLLGLGRRLAVLVAVGNSICGNSAIAAVAPIIGAGRAEIASAVALTAVLGLLMVLSLPLLVPLLQLSHYQYGVLAGLTVYAVPQVLAAAFPVSPLAGEVATLVKLTRVALLGPVVLATTLLVRRAGQVPGQPRSSVLPWFVTGFLAMSLLRATGLLPLDLIGLLREISRLLTILAMAALGLGVDLRVVRQVGPRLLATVAGSLLLLLIVSLTLILALGVGR
jgi:uncharacterized integral membrane protein (TIGR00698 family)